MTAAHCTQGNENAHQRSPAEKRLIGVVVGEHDLRRNDGEKLVQHKRVIPHPGTVPDVKDDGDIDIALLELREDLVFTTAVRPVCLPTDTRNDYGGVLGMNCNTFLLHEHAFSNGKACDKQRNSFSLCFFNSCSDGMGQEGGRSWPPRYTAGSFGHGISQKCRIGRNLPDCLYSLNSKNNTSGRQFKSFQSLSTISIKLQNLLTSVRESSSSSPSSHESSPSLLGGLDRKTLVILKLVAFLFVGMSSPSMGGREAKSFGSVITG